MAVFEDGIDQSWIRRRVGHDRTVIRVEEERAFLFVPTVILTGLHEVDFLDIILADVTDNEPVGRCVEGEAERVAQAVGVDFVHRRAAADEGIARGNAVFPVGTDGIGAARGERRIERIDAQNLAEDGGEILAVAGDVVMTIADVVRSAAIAKPNIEI